MNEHLNSIAKIDFPFYSIDWRFKAKWGKPADILLCFFTTIIIFHFSIFVTFHSIDTTITVPLLKILFFLLSFSLSKGIILPRRERICRGLSRPWLQRLIDLVIARRSLADHVGVGPVSSVWLLKVVIHLHFLFRLPCRGPVLLFTWEKKKLSKNISSYTKSHRWQRLRRKWPRRNGCRRQCRRLSATAWLIHPDCRETWWSAPLLSDISFLRINILI